MKKPLISKKDFLEICKLIEKQQTKDNEFCDFMEGYLNGRFVPMINEHVNTAIDKMMDILFQDNTGTLDSEGYSWWTWFMYEDDFGKKNMEAYTNGKQYVISSPSKFYDFMKEMLKQE